MNDRVNESFSAFLDGEASEVDIQRMLRALDKDPHVRDEWHRLSRVQGVMSGDVLAEIGPTAVAGGRDPVEESRPRSSWRWRLGQAAVASAVALVVVVGARWSAQDAAPVQVAAGPDVELSQVRYEAQQRLNSYLRQHAEAASYSSGHAIVPYQLRWEDSE